MKLLVQKDSFGVREYRLTISYGDLMAANFYQWDYPMLKECEDSESIADKLLALELIARRIEESAPPEIPARGRS